MTLNGVMAVTLRYYAARDSFKANYVKLFEASPMLTPTEM